MLSMMSAMTLVGRTRTFVTSHLESVSTEFAGGTVTMPENSDVLINQSLGKKSMQDF